jgi:hypothetical protein
MLLRGRLATRRWLPAAAALVLTAAAATLAAQPSFRQDLAALRALLGGRAEAERRTIAHQVFATYRRTPTRAWARMLERSRAYAADVAAAATAFGVDAEVLMGIAAAESGFVPRDSADGGRGLFQITAAPATALAAARRELTLETLDLHHPRQGAYVAAAMLAEYRAQMDGDLFLSLLAYNMGPQNGGLRAIMQRYGARDFVTIQPYLQHLPRDYPVRVLAAALAYRLWRAGDLPRYDQGDNARLVQSVGIPGLD